jgi:Zn-finger nucleic acid-binding protein
MQFVVFKSASIDFCAKCRGVWLDAEEVELFLGKRQAPQSKKTDSALSEADFLSPIVGAIIGALFSP